ncbi:hypothetical protein GGX14DRAFT_701331 [Mycena pura]|uniref:Uncharacterized protein n=1 Tax=Mycena pura TaxID=153505 RepID=A0AAD6URA5_9AGAR|nr:hypothetical protein GGX14DRAFT_701331 [Mycena pura]
MRETVPYASSKPESLHAIRTRTPSGLAHAPEHGSERAAHMRTHGLRRAALSVYSAQDIFARCCSREDRRQRTVTVRISRILPSSFRLLLDTWPHAAARSRTRGPHVAVPCVRLRRVMYMASLSVRPRPRSPECRMPKLRISAHARAVSLIRLLWRNRHLACLVRVPACKHPIDLVFLPRHLRVCVAVVPPIPHSLHTPSGSAASLPAQSLALSLALPRLIRRRCARLARALAPPTPPPTIPLPLPHAPAPTRAHTPASTLMLRARDLDSSLSGRSHEDGADAFHSDAPAHAHDACQLALPVCARRAARAAAQPARRPAQRAGRLARPLLVTTRASSPFPFALAAPRAQPPQPTRRPAQRAGRLARPLRRRRVPQRACSSTEPARAVASHCAPIVCSGSGGGGGRRFDWQLRSSTGSNTGADAASGADACDPCVAARAPIYAPALDGSWHGWSPGTLFECTRHARAGRPEQRHACFLTPSSRMPRAGAIASTLASPGPARVTVWRWARLPAALLAPDTAPDAPANGVGVSLPTRSTTGSAAFRAHTLIDVDILAARNSAHAPQTPDRASAPARPASTPRVRSPRLSLASASSGVQYVPGSHTLTVRARIRVEHCVWLERPLLALEQAETHGSIEQLRKRATRTPVDATSCGFTRSAYSF